MPPPVVKTVRDLIFWQYAKIISGSAGFGRTNYRFVMSRFKGLQCGDIFWDEIREYVREKVDECIFVGVRESLLESICFLSLWVGLMKRKMWCGFVLGVILLRVGKGFMSGGHGRVV